MSAPDDVVRLAEERATARAAKDFAASDRLRDEIAGRSHDAQAAPANTEPSP